ncbi:MULTISPECIES: hypothetical protein [unclassified Cupriavidus]|uniref:hypothetical protein n=1 Tax=unclassified Cupriavidus TaxID=2640874 RepID=UPI00313CC1A4
MSQRNPFLAHRTPLLDVRGPAPAFKGVRRPDFRPLQKAWGIAPRALDVPAFVYDQMPPEEEPHG